MIRKKEQTKKKRDISAVDWPPINPLPPCVHHHNKEAKGRPKEATMYFFFLFSFDNQNRPKES